jgi:hypothetical protein
MWLRPANPARDTSLLRLVVRRAACGFALYRQRTSSMCRVGGSALQRLASSPLAGQSLRFVLQRSTRVNTCRARACRLLELGEKWCL